MIDAPLNSFSYDLNISTPEMPGFLSSNPTHMHRRRAACAQADGVVCAQDASGVDDVVASGVVGGDLVVDLGLAEDGFEGAVEGQHVAGTRTGASDCDGGWALVEDQPIGQRAVDGRAFRGRVEPPGLAIHRLGQRIDRGFRPGPFDRGSGGGGHKSEGSGKGETAHGDLRRFAGSGG